MVSLYILAIIVTETEYDRKSNILELPPAQEAKVNLTNSDFHSLDITSPGQEVKVNLSNRKHTIKNKLTGGLTPFLFYH